jgi:hypothetical protein
MLSRYITRVPVHVLRTSYSSIGTSQNVPFYVVVKEKIIQETIMNNIRTW